MTLAFTASLYRAMVHHLLISAPTARSILQLFSCFCAICVRLHNNSNNNNRNNNNYSLGSSDPSALFVAYGVYGVTWQIIFCCSEPFFRKTKFFSQKTIGSVSIFERLTAEKFNKLFVVVVFDSVDIVVDENDDDVVTYDDRLQT